MFRFRASLFAGNHRSLGSAPPSSASISSSLTVLRCIGRLVALYTFRTQSRPSVTSIIATAPARTKNALPFRRHVRCIEIGQCRPQDELPVPRTRPFGDLSRNARSRMARTRRRAPDGEKARQRWPESTSPRIHSRPDSPAHSLARSFDRSFARNSPCSGPRDRSGRRRWTLSRSTRTNLPSRPSPLEATSTCWRSRSVSSSRSWSLSGGRRTSPS